MESEDLTIGQSRVRVSYVFRNKGTAEVRTRVAFPVPPYPEVADYDIQIDRNSRNPMGSKEAWPAFKRFLCQADLAAPSFLIHGFGVYDNVRGRHVVASRPCKPGFSHRTNPAIR